MELGNSKEISNHRTQFAQVVAVIIGPYSHIGRFVLTR